ncbi:uncharacterized protein LOC144917673 [Branchiostoma floridae x Branchiostoma belcheri]
MTDKEIEASVEEGKSGPSPNESSLQSADLDGENYEGEGTSKSLSGQMEEGARGQERVLARAAEEKEKSRKSDKTHKGTGDETVNTPYETRMRVKRQKMMTEGVVESTESPTCKDQELIIDASEEEDTKSEEGSQVVDTADRDAEEQMTDKNTTNKVVECQSSHGSNIEGTGSRVRGADKKTTDDVVCLSSHGTDVGGTGSNMRGEREETATAGNSAGQSKQDVKDGEVVTEEVPTRMRTRLGAVREAGETTEGSVRVADENQQASHKAEGGEVNSRPPWRDGRRRRCRTKYSREQLMAMEELFMRNRYPDIVEREDLAERIALTEDRIQVWFQNRRSRWRARERKLQKAAEGTAAKCSQAAAKPNIPSSTSTTSQPARPLPVLIIPAAGFPLMQQYFSAMSSNVTDGTNAAAGVPMVLQCTPATQSQHAQGTAPSTSSNSTTEASNVTTTCTTSSTATKPRNIAPKLDSQKLPFPYTIGFAYFPSQVSGAKGLTNTESQTVSASLVIPANQGQLGSVEGHKGGGRGPTLSPLLRAVESELQANNVPVSVTPATPSSAAKNNDSLNEACSSSMQLRSKRSVRPVAPMPTETRTTQRRHSTCRYPLPSEDPQAVEQTTGGGTSRKTVTCQSATPMSCTGHRIGIARQRGAFSQIDSRPCTSTHRSLGTGFTRIDHSGRIQAPNSHDSSASPVPLQPIQRRRARTFSEGSGGCVPTGCFLSKPYAQSRSEGAFNGSEAANSRSLLTGMRPVPLPRLQRQVSSSSSCRVKMTSDNQGVILEDRTPAAEIFRVPPRRRANSLTQPVFRPDATPTVKARPLPVNYGQSTARGNKMPQALFEDMHSPPPRARVASLSDILPRTRQNKDTSIFRKERPDHQPVVHSASSTVPPISDVISLAFKTVNTPVQTATTSSAPMTGNTTSGRFDASPVAGNKDSPRPLLPGKGVESVHGGDADVVFVGKVSCPSKQDDKNKDNPNFVILENSNASGLPVNHVADLMPHTDSVEKGHDGNNNMSPLQQMKNVVDRIDKPDVVTVHDTVGEQVHVHPYSNVQQGDNEHETTFAGLVVEEDATGAGMTAEIVTASEVPSGGMPHETCQQLASQEHMSTEAWMEDNSNSTTSSIYETPVAASSENTRFIQTLNQHQPYMSGPTNQDWRSETLQNNSEAVPVAFAPTMPHGANQQCMYTGTTSFQNQSHGAAGSYGRMVQPWAGDPTQTQQQGPGNITMNTLFLWQQNINLAQQVSLTNILARHNPFPKPHVLFTNPPASISTTNHILGAPGMTPTNDQSSTMVSHHPQGLAATPRDYYTSSSTKLTYVNSNRNWFGLNGQGLPPTGLPGVQRMNCQGVLPGQLSAQGLQTFQK